MERTIELTVISATDLKKVVKFGKQTCYAVAYIDPEQTKKTKKDEDGGTDPTWNQKLEFTCDEQKLLEGGMVITVEMYSDGTFSDKLIGTVTIPISDIAKEALGKEGKVVKDGEEKEERGKEKESQEAQYLAFEVHRPSGKAKGVLNVAVKLGEKKNFKVYQSQPSSEPEAYGAYDQRDAQSSFEPQVPYQTGYPARPPPGYPNQYPPQYGAPPPQYGAPPPQYGAPSPQYGAPPPQYGAPPPQYANQYPPQQMPYYPQQPAPYYPQQPPPYYQQQPQQGRGGSGLSAGGGLALGLGAGLVGGAIGGLLVADVVDDIGDDCDDGDF